MISMTITSCTDFSLDVPHRPSKSMHSEVNLCFFPSKLNHENIKRKGKEKNLHISHHHSVILTRNLGVIEMIAEPLFP